MFLAVGAGTARAEWEGNAGMAAASEFPLSRMYARSDMFPKNTIVEIRNLETEITVRAVITGSAGIPGLVAVLSPLTASALQIRTGSVSRVRISVPSPVSERPAPGTVTAGSALETADPDVNPAAATASAAAVPPAAAAPVPAAAVSPAAESLTLSALASTSEDPLVPVPAPAAPMVAAAEPVPAPVPAPVPVAAAEPVVPADTDTVAAAVSEPLPETPVASTEVVPAGSPVAAAIFIDEPSLEPAPFAEAPPADAVPDLPSAEETALSAAAVYTAAEYSATLEPAEPNPPAAPAVDAPLSVPEVGVPAPPAAIPVPAAAAVAAVAAVPPAAVAVPGEPVRLPVIPSLAKGSYYVQIATYSDPVNAKKLVDSYSKKYPVSVERTATKGGEVLKVLIGPVKKDEFGAVLERFKSLGFKDAFVKKGQ